MNSPASQRDRPVKFGYLFATTLILVAFFVTRLVPHLMGQEVFDLFIGAIFYTAWYVGFGPSALAAILSILVIDYFFLPPLNAFYFGVENITRLTVFAAVTFFVSVLSARLREAQRQLQAIRDELELRVEKRTEDLSRANDMLQEEIAHRLAAEKEILDTSNREQRRLGEDLHDGLCQILVGVRMIGRELKQNLTTENPQRVNDASRIETLLTEALMQADSISRGLFPVELDTNGLMAALQELAEKSSLLHRCSCLFICRTPVFFEDGAIANSLYRIVQEAVANSIKRGKAKRIRIRIVKRDRAMLLSVIDDGIGIQSQNIRRGMGLKMMEYRARMVNATFNVRSRAKGVTLVACVMNYNHETVI